MTDVTFADSLPAVVAPSVPASVIFLQRTECDIESEVPPGRIRNQPPAISP
jgi:hypothetical protein